MPGAYIRLRGNGSELAFPRDDGIPMSSIDVVRAGVVADGHLPPIHVTGGTPIGCHLTGYGYPLGVSACFLFLVHGTTVPR